MVSKLSLLLAAVIVSSVEASPILNFLCRIFSSTCGSGCQGPSKSYRADLVSGVSDRIRGTVYFNQKCPNSPVEISGTIWGLPPNSEHGFHVHELPNLTGNCSGAGGHFNPFNRKHGAPTNDESSRHVGDMGNIKADRDGVARFRMVDNVMSMDTGVRGISRRAVMVHSGKDDLGTGGNPGSWKTGNAGKRLACGVIAPAPPPQGFSLGSLFG